MNVGSLGGESREHQSIASWWHGRFGVRLLWEIALCGGLMIGYREVRTFTKTDIRDAFDHAREVVQFEQWLGMPFEDDLQRFLLDNETIIKLLNHYYIWFHFPVAVLVLLWLYARHPSSYRPIRNLMTFVTLAALAIHLVFPLAPPRMMSEFVDTMRTYGPSIYSVNALDGAANQIAAMPSLHFAWAMIESMAIISVFKSAARWLSVLHPALMTVSIIVTANHWWIDAAVAAVIVLLSVAVWRILNDSLRVRHDRAELEPVGHLFGVAMFDTGPKGFIERRSVERVE